MSTISNQLELHGLISTRNALQGIVSSLGNLNGNILVDTTIHGDIATCGNISGSLTRSYALQGCITESKNLIGSAMICMNYSDIEIYDGVYEVIPNIQEQSFNTVNKKMKSNMIVHATPYSEVSNDAGGYTLTIL